MPLYEYRCRLCRSTFEVLQKAGDPPPAKCPACEGPVEKCISPPAIQFKGNGWYITDYARKSGPAADKAPEAKGEGASESKPAAEKNGPEKPTAPASK